MSEAENKRVTLEVLLPIFSGYYNTIFDVHDQWWEYEFNNLTEGEGKTEDEAAEFLDSLNYPAARLGTSIALVDGFESLFNTTFDTDIKVKYDYLESPREYNFTNDKIVCQFDFNLKVIQDLHTKNIESFQDFITAQFTQRSGFIPFYSNELEEWDINELEDFDAVQLWTVFSALCEMEGLDEMDLYNECGSSLDEAFSDGMYTPIEEGGDQ